MRLPQRLARSGIALLCLIALSLGTASAALAGNSSFFAGDSNSLTKAIIADTYTDPPSTANDKIARIGDTATYRLTLNLSEGTTGNVIVQDSLPNGLAYAGMIGITPASGTAPFTYTIISQPAVGTVGGMTWNLGDVLNTPSNDGTPSDPLVIEYQAIVRPDVGTPIPTAVLPNTAFLQYSDETYGVHRLTDSDSLTVHQPVMSPIVKLGNGSANTVANPLNVNVITNTVQFHLESCNSTGQAPAYGVQISDVLASQLDETSLTVPQVAVGGTVLGAGGYTYTPPAVRGGRLTFVLNAPVDPGQCVTIDYAIGFHIDFGPNQIWSNDATIDHYWSLPPAAGQNYTLPTSANFYMSNLVNTVPLTKNLLAPVSRRATIGEQATYQITVPGTPIGSALNSVVVNDTLHGALAFVGATATLNGAPLAISTTQVGQDLHWDIPIIPAGQQLVLTLTTRVDNNTLANAGTMVSNTASYTYDAITAGEVTDGSSAPLTIVEPTVTLTKSVTPSTPPVAGDVLAYRVNLIAAGGANTATAFDAVLDDTLSLGLTYVAGSARVAGVAIEPTVTGDGITTPQALSWTGGIDIPAGTTVAVTYDVRVLGTVVAGQILTNSAIAHWTGLAGANTDERTGSGTPVSNDYVTAPATTSLTVPIPNLTLSKVVDKPVAAPGERLQYTLTLSNPSGIALADLTLVDDLEALNATPMFQPGSISNIVVPAGAIPTVSGNTLTVTNLDVAPNSSLTIRFEADLATNLASGSAVLNQARLTGPWLTPIRSDDPNRPGNADPTLTTIPANGIVYDASTHTPLAGVTLTMLRAATTAPLPASCFIDPAQQNQVTQADGTYRFDLVFNATNCPDGDDYLIAITSAPVGYVAEPSLIELPSTSAATAAYSVPVCPADAILATALCEADASATVPAGAPTYYLHLIFGTTANQIYNNHIPIDPQIEETISVIKTTPLINVTRSQIVPYRISIKNTLRTPPPPLGVIDTLPPGFKYVDGSARFDGVPLAPVASGRQLRWDNLAIGYNRTHTIELLLVVGAGVTESQYTNQAQVIDSSTSAALSAITTATVRVVPDPTLDCTDVIGKVFDDRDLDGQQSAGEQGLSGVRIVTARGLVATSDANGRFHITCAAVPDEDRGSNFILKLDERTLPTGYRLTTENPRVQRATRGKMLRFNFGATIHRVVTLDVADGVFEPEQTVLRLQWQPKIDRLLEELHKAPSILRLSYLADIENEELIDKRLKALKKQIADRWQKQGDGYRLDMETEIFWRRGGPP
jgi:fimbrial isopeptide formation D2 family protein/uncharacterized repeat protein (TIGR01451 family)